MPLLEVGRIVKPHGLRGEVVVHLVTNREERVAPGAVLASDKGDLTVDASRQHRRDWIVTFAGIVDRSDAETYRGLVLRAEAFDEPDGLWVHDLIGAEVVDAKGESHGTVVSVEANPAADLLVLEGGELVPVSFIVEADRGRVVVDPPAGLLD